MGVQRWSRRDTAGGRISRRLEKKGNHFLHPFCAGCPRSASRGRVQGAGPTQQVATSDRPSHCTWAWIHSSRSEFSFSRTPSFTCEQSSSAFSRACFKWLWSGWLSGVFSRICRRAQETKVSGHLPQCRWTWDHCQGSHSAFLHGTHHPRSTESNGDSLLAPESSLGPCGGLYSLVEAMGAQP